MSAPTSIAHYRIVSKLGEGGMGAVYRANDTRLNRDVAIKVLPDSLASDAGRMARFEREAQMLAALNHPNIAAIYGVEQGAIIMELVEGEDLRGPLPIDTALAYAKQIVAALEAAHEKGIIHRDLKPANIKVTPDGVVKLLDFGLAKGAEASTASAGGNPTQSPTLSITMTQAGMILGTAAYMSPEQARGKPVDRRADIWAFGAVFYEMLSGRQVFGGGETVTDTIAAVVSKEPDWPALPKETPAHIRRLLERCLRKDVKTRLQAIGEARIAIDEAPVVEAEKAPAVVQPAPRSWFPWIVAGVLLAATLMLGFIAYRHVTEETRVLKFSVLPPEKATLSSGGFPMVSPDGRRLAFVVDREGVGIAVRDLDSLTSRILPGTEDANYPFWSPDSRSLAFFSNHKLKKIDIAGGPALTLCDAPQGRGGSWSKNDVILFTGGNRAGLSRVPAAGGDPTPATDLDPALSEISHRFPWFLPDGHHFLYSAYCSPSEKSKVYVADLESRSRKEVLAVNSKAVYAAPGYLLFLRDETFMAQSFDTGKLRPAGDAVPVAEQVRTTQTDAGQFSASQNGVLAYSSGGGSGFGSQLTWLDRAGKVSGTVGAPVTTNWPSISPDGATVSVDRRDPSGSFDIWLYDLTRGSASRFTFAAGDSHNSFPEWSPDGSHIAFFSRRGVYQKAASGAAQEEPLDTAPSSGRPVDWSRDGRYIIEEVIARSGYEIWVLPLFGDRKRFPYLHSQFSEKFAKVSPDGRWLAYQSDETKRVEVYVQSFPTPEAKFQASTNGGSRPIWSRDGKELFFIGADQKMMAVAVSSGARFQAGVPKPLFDTHIPSFSWFDVSKDGRFLVPELPELKESGAVVPISVVVNWTAGLKK